MSRRKSPIWLVDRETLKELVEKADTIKEILNCFGLSHRGRNYTTLKRRLEEEGIPYPVDAGKRGMRICNIKNKKQLSEVLVENSSFGPWQLKRRLLEEGRLENICAVCGQEPTWNDKPLVLELDHINGDGKDNRIENLRIICPHCHSQTKNFRGRNKRTNKPNKSQIECNIKTTLKDIAKRPQQPQKKTVDKCPQCKELFKPNAPKQKFCSNECGTKSQRRVERPSKEELKELVWEYPTSKLGKIFNVSDKAVEKWCKRYDISKPSRGYWAKKKAGKI